jgi:hypothetical protein
MALVWSCRRVRCETVGGESLERSAGRARAPGGSLTPRHGRQRLLRPTVAIGKAVPLMQPRGPCFPLRDSIYT